MRVTIRFHHMWLEAMKVVWTAMWAHLISKEDATPDLPNEYEFEEGPNETVKFKAEWSDGGSEPVSLDVWMVGDKHTITDFLAELTQCDTMGMVRSKTHVDGRVVRANSAYSVEIVQEY